MGTSQFTRIYQETIVRAGECVSIEHPCDALFLVVAVLEVPTTDRQECCHVAAVRCVGRGLLSRTGSFWRNNHGWRQFHGLIYHANCNLIAPRGQSGMQFILDIERELFSLWKSRWHVQTKLWLVIHCTSQSWLSDRTPIKLQLKSINLRDNW